MERAAVRQTRRGASQVGRRPEDPRKEEAQDQPGQDQRPRQGPRMQPRPGTGPGGHGAGAESTCSEPNERRHKRHSALEVPSGAGRSRTRGAAGSKEAATNGSIELSESEVGTKWVGTWAGGGALSEGTKRQAFRWSQTCLATALFAAVPTRQHKKHKKNAANKVK